MLVEISEIEHSFSFALVVQIDRDWLSILVDIRVMSPREYVKYIYVGLYPTLVIRGRPKCNGLILPYFIAVRPNRIAEARVSVICEHARRK